MSLACDAPFAQTYWAEVGSDDRRGRIFGRYILTETAYLAVHEVVEVVDDSHIHRIEYAYYLIINGFEIWGYERDPNHEAEGLLDHMHTEEHGQRLPSEPVSFKQAAEMAWDEITRRGLIY